MTAISPNALTIREALNGIRKVYSIARHPKLYLATPGAVIARRPPVRAKHGLRRRGDPSSDKLGIQDDVMVSLPNLDGLLRLKAGSQ